MERSRPWSLHGPLADRGRSKHYSEGHNQPGPFEERHRERKSQEIHVKMHGQSTGVAGQANLASVDPSWASWYVRNRCHTSPLAGSLTTNGWPTIFGQASDVVVPRTSQLAGLDGIELIGTIHSSGMTSLGFTGPSELETAGNGPAEVIRLLNLSRLNAAYKQLP